MNKGCNTHKLAALEGSKMKRRRIVIAGKDGLFKWAIWPEYRAPEYTRLINWNSSNMHLVLVYQRIALVVAGPLQVYTRSQ